MPPVIDLPRLQEIRKKLKELPKAERVKTFSGPEALEALKKDIQALSRKGYYPKEIADFLKQEGLVASAGKVRKLLTEPEEGNGSPDRPEAEDANQPTLQDSGPLTPASEKSDGEEAQL